MPEESWTRAHRISIMAIGATLLTTVTTGSIGVFTLILNPLVQAHLPAALTFPLASYACALIAPLLGCVFCMVGAGLAYAAGLRSFAADEHALRADQRVLLADQRVRAVEAENADLYVLRDYLNVATKLRDERGNRLEHLRELLKLRRLNFRDTEDPNRVELIEIPSRGETT